jgi:hypothetical protein
VRLLALSQSSQGNDAKKYGYGRARFHRQEGLLGI